MPAKQNRNNSLNKVYINRTSNINLVKNFGCLIHVDISAMKRNKLNRVSFQKIFVNYHSSTQMRIFDPMTKKIQWHIAVKFLENSPGGRLPGSSGKEDELSIGDGCTSYGRPIRRFGPPKGNWKFQENQSQPLARN